MCLSVSPASAHSTDGTTDALGASSTAAKAAAGFSMSNTTATYTTTSPTASGGSTALTGACPSSSEWCAAMTAVDKRVAEHHLRHPTPTAGLPASVHSHSHSQRCDVRRTELTHGWWVSIPLQVGGVQGARAQLGSHGHVHSVEGSGRRHAHAQPRRLSRHVRRNWFTIELPINYVG
jgi:hypothetical protein